jgi:hypothetical protein
MNRDLIIEYFEQYLVDPLKMRLDSYTLEEQKSDANIQMSLLVNDELITVSGQGVGLVDAGFNAFVSHFSEKHPSLSTISLSDVYFQIDTSAKDALNLKSKTIMKLEFENDRKSKVCFMDRTASMGFTAVSVLTKAIEFYVNSETLFKRVKFLIEEAESRSRPDVAAQYKYALSKVVEVTSYQYVS